MRIYFVIDLYHGPSGGTERQLQLLVSGLVADGHDVRLFVLRQTGFTANGNTFPCPIECLDVGSMASLSTAAKMLAFRRRIKRDRPDAVHAFFNDAAVLVPIFCKLSGVRVFTSRRDMGYWYTPAYLRALAVANRRVDRILCNARAVAEEVRRRERSRPGQIQVIPNACHVSVDEPASPLLVQEDQDPIIGVCLVANVRRIKRIEDLLQAAALVCSVQTGVRFTIVGAHPDTAYFAELERIVAELDLAEFVEFLPDCDSPLTIIKKSDIGVLTSSSEGMSNTIMEYMACGLAVVCSDVGGNPELVQHGREGYCYPVGAVDQLAAYILELCRSPELRRHIGERGRARAQQFSLERMVAQYCSHYGDAPMSDTGDARELRD